MFQFVVEYRPDNVHGQYHVHLIWDLPPHAKERWVKKSGVATCQTRNEALELAKSLQMQGKAAGIDDRTHIPLLGWDQYEDVIERENERDRLRRTHSAPGS